jgi:hypothetical protein
MSNKWPTLLDLYRSWDPDGSPAAVVEILTETNEMLLDIPFMEGNLPTGHRTTIRAGLPEPTWRQFYGGVQPTKGQRVQVTDNTAMLEAYAEVDAAMADLNGNTAAFRMQEDYGHLEGMSQAMQQALIYGNASINPTQFNGLAPRYNDLNADNGDNIIDCGGTGNTNASIWLAVWGPQTAHGIYPKGMQGGVQMEDKGKVTIENVDGNNGRMEAYRTHYSWKTGLTVRDWRYIVRACNIDRAALSPDALTGANLPNIMFEMLERLPSTSIGTPIFYMDRSLRTILRQQLANGTKNSTLVWENLGGVRTAMFQETIIRRVDRLAVNEARVV